MELGHKMGRVFSCAQYISMLFFGIYLKFNILLKLLPNVEWKCDEVAYVQNYDLFFLGI